jgi:hypothetical protein
MENLLNKISEYKFALYEKSGSKRLVLKGDEMISIGEDISIFGITLGGIEDNEVMVCSSSGIFLGSVNLNCLSDSVLNRILNVLLSKM